MALNGKADLEFKSQDYILFMASLIISMIIGFVAPCFGNNNKPTVKDFLLGGGSMHYIPVGFSILGSVMNAVFFLGGPSVVYFNGGIYGLKGIAFLLVCPISALLFVPIFRQTEEGTSCYEYLEKRFNRFVRILAAIVFTAYMLVFLGVVLYAPALAFSEVTGLPMWFSVCITALFCTKYTVVGGIKSVVWTDTYQVLVTFLGFLIIVSMGAHQAGSPREIADAVHDGKRLDFNHWSPDPREHVTVWTLTIGQFFTWISLFGCNQMVIQRYFTVPTKRDAQKAVMVACVLSQIMIMLVTVTGLVMYAFNKDCDPYSTNKIKERDQMLPFFLMDIANGRPGLPGLFAAALFSAALSTMSSAINSMASVCLEDFIKPIMEARNRPVKEQAAVNISKILSFVFGLASLGMSYIATYFGQPIIQIPITIWGMVGGPLLGVFLLGMLFPCCGPWGASIGLIGSLILILWMQIGSTYKSDPLHTLPLSYQCMFDEVNSTFVPPSENVHDFDDDSSLQGFYNVSSVWYGLIGLLACIILGLIATAIFDWAVFVVLRRKKFRAVPKDTVMFPLNWGECCMGCCPCIDNSDQDIKRAYIVSDNSLTETKIDDGHVNYVENGTRTS